MKKNGTFLHALKAICGNLVPSDRGAEAASLLLGRKPFAQWGATDRWLLCYKLLPCIQNIQCNSPTVTICNIVTFQGVCAFTA